MAEAREKGGHDDWPVRRRVRRRGVRAWREIPEGDAVLLPVRAIGGVVWVVAILGQVHGVCGHMAFFFFAGQRRTVHHRGRRLGGFVQQAAEARNAFRSCLATGL